MAHHLRLRESLRPLDWAPILALSAVHLVIGEVLDALWFERWSLGWELADVPGGVAAFEPAALPAQVVGLLLTNATFAWLFARLDVRGVLRGLGLALFLWVGFELSVVVIHYLMITRPAAIMLGDAGSRGLDFALAGVVLALWQRRREQPAAPDADAAARPRSSHVNVLAIAVLVALVFVTGAIYGGLDFDPWAALWHFGTEDANYLSFPEPPAYWLLVVAMAVVFNVALALVFGWLGVRGWREGLAVALLLWTGLVFSNTWLHYSEVRASFWLVLMDAGNRLVDFAFAGVLLGAWLPRARQLRR